MSLRDAMPQTAAFIDFCREAFGADAVNVAIRKGIGGLPGHFHAAEAGREVGTPFQEPGHAVTGDALLAHLPYQKEMK